VPGGWLLLVAAAGGHLLALSALASQAYYDAHPGARYRACGLACSIAAGNMAPSRRYTATLPVLPLQGALRTAHPQCHPHLL
jgi:hypothetical protein